MTRIEAIKKTLNSKKEATLWVDDEMITNWNLYMDQEALNELSDKKIEEYYDMIDT